MDRTDLSIVLPAHNEAASLRIILPRLKELFSEADILVIDDASDDDTPQICTQNGVRVISHKYQQGNGAAVKTGARNAVGDIIVFMDADNQHSPEDVNKLLDCIRGGYDMAVGARVKGTQATVLRSIANKFYNIFASWITGHKIKDLTSGFRAVNADKFREFIMLLPNGFSYPTTITMAFFRSGYSVKYVPVEVNKRHGKSHIKPITDGIRFLLIIFKVGTLYSPLKFFFPISFLFFIMGAGYYLYTFLSASRFTNMGVLLLTTSILIFLIGLVSEQLTMLFYRDRK